DELQSRASFPRGSSSARISAGIAGSAQSLSDPEEPVRGAAAFALADLSDWAEPAIPALIRALDEPLGNDALDWSSSARTGAAAALERIGSPAVPSLIDALIAGSESRKTTISTILVNIGPPAVPSVSKALAEADSENGIHFQAILLLISAEQR
ncbi:MAG: HEAT repeat domain-containing protein, partial [Woeseiaceae bacterium]|nr:HEAT repeat domain-containing protein [Woeseiaceae bacterium]